MGVLELASEVNPTISLKNTVTQENDVAGTVLPCFSSSATAGGIIPEQMKQLEC